MADNTKTRLMRKLREQFPDVPFDEATKLEREEYVPCSAWRSVSGTVVFSQESMSKCLHENIKLVHHQDMTIEVVLDKTCGRCFGRGFYNVPRKTNGNEHAIWATQCDFCNGTGVKP